VNGSEANTLSEIRPELARPVVPRLDRRGATIWLTGLPSAGKSTIAIRLADVLSENGHRVEILDGDEMRRLLSAGLGFDRADRDANVQRIGFVAELLARNGVKTVVPVIAPFASSRAAVRQRHERSGTAFLEIHVATPLAVCAERDVKGLYARQRRGELTGLTGVDDPYELPEAPDARIETTGRGVDDCVGDVMAILKSRDLL
jgi:adenylylsulfate kinase